MAPPKKNEFYKRRQKDGRELIYKTPDLLLEEAYKYFDWCNKNPVKKNEAIKSGPTAGKIIQIPTQRPYTLQGLCVHIGISMDTFKNYSLRDDFLGVTTHIREVIQANQLEGAMVEAYNPNIVARMLGLSDKKEISGKDGGELVINVLSEKTREGISKLKESSS